MSDDVILITDDRAAKRMTVTGWVSRDGRFYGDDEQLARWAGCTHVQCDYCGQPTPKGWLACGACRAENQRERWEALPRAEWDGETPIYSHTADKFFFDTDSLADFCDENECAPDSLQLVLCEPEMAGAIDPDDYYSDSIPDDGELPDAVVEAFDALNRALAEFKEPLSWHPGKTAVTVAQPEQEPAVKDHLTAEQRAEQEGEKL